MVGCRKRLENYTGINFVHYAGDATRKLLKEDLEKGIIE